MQSPSRLASQREHHVNYPVLKVREGGRTVNIDALLACGVNADALLACGVNADGHREILGLHVSSAKAGAGWLAFFSDLAACGLSGFSIDGVDVETSVLLEGWRDRLVRVQNANTAGVSAHQPQFTAWCLDKEDLCVANSVPTGKDQNFVGALLDANLVDPRRDHSAPSPGARQFHPNVGRALEWLEACTDVR